MLERAINLVNFDKKYALNLFTNLSGGFQLNDLYVFVELYINCSPPEYGW